MGKKYDQAMKKRAEERAKRLAKRNPSGKQPYTISEDGTYTICYSTGMRAGYNPCPKCGKPKMWKAKQCANCAGESWRYTSFKRDQMGHALCGRPRKTTGTPCKNYAGMGTRHPGYGPCKTHGGNTPWGEKQALRIKAEIQMREDLEKVARQQPRTIAPEEAIQWLLDTGWVRCNRWEDAMEEWDSMSASERAFIISLSMGERREFREVAGLARRTGYRPEAQAREMAQAVYMALSKALDTSGLGNDARVGALWDSIIDSLSQEEQLAKRAAQGGSDKEEMIEGTVITPDVDGDGEELPADYMDWPLGVLRAECADRGITVPRRVTRKAALVEALLEDDSLPESRRRSADDD